MVYTKTDSQLRDYLALEGNQWHCVFILLILFGVKLVVDCCFGKIPYVEMFFTAVQGRLSVLA